MPPRLVTLSVVAFWLVSMGWLFVRDLWPELRPGQRPPFTIDLAREMTGKRSGTQWVLHRNGVRIGYANTLTRFRPSEQTYELLTRVYFERDTTRDKRHAFGIQVLGTWVEISRMETSYRVNAAGELQKLDSRVFFSSFPTRHGPEDERAGIDSHLFHVGGDVKDGVFYPQASIQSPLFEETRKFELEPVEVPSANGMLNPLHPWNRLLNIRPGQTWRITLFDPLAEAMASPLLGGRRGPRRLEAGVHERTEELFWENQAVDCLIIEYRGDNLTARTYVRRSDGLVLRQEVEQENDRLSLERESR
jgi:hypothetical protein